MFTDSHCHINADDFNDDREDAVIRARTMRVPAVFCGGHGRRFDQRLYRFGHCAGRLLGAYLLLRSGARLLAQFAERKRGARNRCVVQGGACLCSLLGADGRRGQSGFHSQASGCLMQH